MRLSEPLTPTFTVAVCPKLFGGIDNTFEGDEPKVLIGFLWLVAPFEDATFSVATTIDKSCSIGKLLPSGLVLPPNAHNL
jgi:hypothetical protein